MYNLRLQNSQAPKPNSQFVSSYQFTILLRVVFILAFAEWEWYWDIELHARVMCDFDVKPSEYTQTNQSFWSNLLRCIIFFDLDFIWPCFQF